MSELTPEQLDRIQEQYAFWLEELRQADPSPSRALKKVAGEALVAGLRASPLWDLWGKANAPQAEDGGPDATERPRPS